MKNRRESDSQSTGENKSYVAYVLDQLHLVDDIRIRPMFGGFGVYCQQYFFALIWEDTLYVFTSQESRKKYRKAGMEPFVFKEGQSEGNYFAVPDTVLADTKKLTAWVKESVACRAEFERQK